MTRGFLLRRLKALHADEGGNIIVLYVAAALLLVGMLWALIGTGARMVQKETIQSSADAAAFSAAVIKAKGLNIIAFCNLLMAVLLAVIMLLRLIEGALYIVAAGAAVACFFGATVLCPIPPWATSTAVKYRNIREQIEPRIMDAMKGLAKLERAVNKTFPALAAVEAYRVGTHDSYQKHFGKGTLVTVAWPLPVGKDLSLPTKDGTWDQLCDEAVNTFDRVVKTTLSKIGVPSVVAGAFGGALKKLLSPLKGILCGSGGGGSGALMVDKTVEKTSCGECSGAEATRWIGDRVSDTDTNVILARGETVSEAGFNAYLCNNEPDGRRLIGNKWYINAKFVSCLKREQQPVDVGSGLKGDKPVPLILADDWKQRVNVRAFTLLSDTNMELRRRSVNVASKNKGSAPQLNQLLGTAQAEVLAFNGKEDLWHMNWRARLVRFTFGDTSETNPGEAGAAGLPAGAAAGVSAKIQEFLLKDGAAVFADQFLLH